MNIIELKVVIDTNVIISIVSLRSRFRWVFNAIIKGDIRLSVSTDILLEYAEILQQKTNPVIAENIVNFFSSSPFVEKTEIFYKFNLIQKDNTDNKFVDCAISSNSDCIISNDRHFQTLKTIAFPKVELFTLEEFSTKYEADFNAVP